MPPLNPMNSNQFFQQVTSHSPVSVLELFDEIKNVNFFVYNHLAQQFYSEDEYKIFYERVKKLSSKDSLLDIKHWIVDRNKEPKKRSLSLTISLHDLPKVPEIFRQLTTLNHMIFLDTGSCRRFDLTGWNYLKKVSAISCSNELNDAYLLSTENEFMKDTTSRLLKIDDSGYLADDEEDCL